MTTTHNSDQARVDIDVLVQTFVALDNAVVLFDANGNALSVHGDVSWRVDAADAAVLPHAIRALLLPIVTKTLAAGPQVTEIALAPPLLTDPHRCEIRSMVLQNVSGLAGQSVVLLAVRRLSTLTPAPDELRRIVDAIPWLIFRLDEAMVFRGVTGPRDWLVVNEDSLLGSPVDDVVTEHYAAAFKAHLAYARKHGTAPLHTYTLSVGGHKREFEARFVWLNNMYVAYVHEIEGRAAILQYLRESDGWFKQLADQAKDALIVHTLKGQILYANDVARTSFGYGHIVPPTANIYDLLQFADDEAARLQQQRRLAGDRSTFRFDAEICSTENGRCTPAEFHATMITIEGHDVILAMGRDVSEKRQAKAERSRALRRATMLLNNTVEAVVVTSYAGRILEANPALTRMFGLSSDAIVGQNIVHLLQLDLDSSAAAMDTATMQPTSPTDHDHAATRFETQIQHRNGHSLDVEVTAYLVNADNDPRIYYFIRDITQIRATERYLQRVAIRWQTLYEVNNAILSASTFDDIVQLVLLRVPLVLNVDMCSLTLRADDDSGDFIMHVMDTTHAPNQLFALPMQQKTIYGIEHLRRGEAVIVEDIHALDLDLQRYPMIQQAINVGIRSFLCMPILHQAQLVAVLHAAVVEKPGAFSEDDVFVLRGIVTSLSIAYEQAQLHQQLEEYARTLESKVQSRTAELAHVNERLLELDRLKTAFVTEVSHELRTPVNNLVMRLALLEIDAPDQIPKHHRMLRQQAEHLGTLVEDILQLSRIDMSRANITFRRVELNRIVQAVIDAHQPRADLKGLELSFIAGAIPALLGEPNQLSQVVTNLVTNALNYTQTGRIVVETRRAADEGFVELIVTDTGIGIPEDERELIFDRFFRGRNVTKSQIAGTGLGLGIVTEILNIHGGKIDVRDHSPQGSRFVVRLPIIEHTI